MKHFQLPPILLLKRIDSRYIQKFLKNASACSQNCSQFYIVVCISRSLLLASCKVMQYTYVHRRSSFSSFELEPKLAHLHDFVEEAIQCLSLEGKSVTLLLAAMQYIEYVTTKPPKPKNWRCVGGGDGAHRKDFLNFCFLVLSSAVSDHGP